MRGVQTVSAWSGQGSSEFSKPIAVGIALANAKEDPSDSSFGLP